MSEPKTAEVKTIESVGDYVREYEFRGDGGDYTPNEGERLLIEDAIHGFISATPASPPAETGEGESEVERLKGKLRNVVSHATGGNCLEGDDLSLNEISVRITQFRNKLYEAGKQSAQPVSPSEGEAVASIVPAHCTGTSLSFDPGVLHVSKDGSGYIAISEEHFSLEDDRCEGPDGPEGSVHWITRMDASEVTALRDFLTGAAHPASDQSDTETMRAAFDYVCGLLPSATLAMDREADTYVISCMVNVGELRHVRELRAALDEKAADK